MEIKVNGEVRKVDVDPETPLLWVLRDELRLTGTKFGCGIAACGACTVHVNGMPIRSCITAVSSIEGMEPKRFRKPGWPSTCRSAGTASQARSCPPLRC